MTGAWLLLIGAVLAGAGPVMVGVFNGASVLAVGLCVAAAVRVWQVES